MIKLFSLMKVAQVSLRLFSVRINAASHQFKELHLHQSVLALKRIYVFTHTNGLFDFVDRNTAQKICTYL